MNMLPFGSAFVGHVKCIYRLGLPYVLPSITHGSKGIRSPGWRHFRCTLMPLRRTSKETKNIFQ